MEAATTTPKETAATTTAARVVVELLPGAPAFQHGLHRRYIIELADKLEHSYEGAVTDHLRMSGVYWSLTALSLLLPADQVMAEMRVFENNATSENNNNHHKNNNTTQSPQSMMDWIFTCYDTKTGGFGGNTGQDAHLLYTLSALQLLALTGCPLQQNQQQQDAEGNTIDNDDDSNNSQAFFLRHRRESVIQFIASLQQSDGSFCGDQWGEVDTRFTYCALQSLALLGALERVDVPLAARYILSCRNMDGGFGCVPGAESHAGQVFCCIGALAIAQHLHLLTDNDIDLLGWWLCERQVDSGGLNGRPEKQSDVCYSWWILSTMSILNKVSWISETKLATFILNCQDDDDGGIADRPHDMPDVYHTFFGIAGLSLLGYLHHHHPQNDIGYRKIDPIYALPTDVVKRLQLPGQVVVSRGQVDERLSHYQTYDPSKES